MSDRRLWRRTAGEVKREVEEELEFHLGERVAELERDGRAATEARHEAARRFGDVDTVLRDCVSSDLRRERRQQRHEYLRDLLQDARIGFRQLRRRPLLAVVAVLTLGLSIGAAASIYALADHVLLRPLPYEEPNRIVTLWETERTRGAELGQVSPANYLDWEKATSFSAMGLATPYSVDLTGEGPPVALHTLQATPHFFDALGVRPILGRVFAPEDFRTGARVVLLSHGVWQRRFGGDARVLGRALVLDGNPTEVIGVLPPSLEYPEPTEAWVPKVFRDEELTDRYSAYMFTVARLAPGVSLEQAQAELDVMVQRLSPDHEVYREMRVRVVPLADRVLGGARRPVAALLAGALLLVLIACANLANVLVARGMERTGELAVRGALGAARSRLARQLITEALILAVAGGAAGALLASLGIRALIAVAPPDLPRLAAVTLDARVLVFLMAITALTGVLFGLAPALRLSRQDAMSAIRSASLRPPEHTRLRGALLSGQVALCLVLLIGAGLLARSMAALLDNELGFEHNDRATMQLFIWDHVHTDEERILRVAELIDRFEALPGVQRAAAITSLPFLPHAINARSAVVFDGAAEPRPRDAAAILSTVATPGYFEVMDIPLLAGRSFQKTDRAGSPAVVLINEAFARRFFPDSDPVGRRVTLGVMGPLAQREIIGVVGNVRASAFDSEPEPEFFIPHAQSGSGSMTFVVQTAGAEDALLQMMQTVVWSIEPAQTIYYMATMDDLVRATVASRRFQLSLAGVFAALALTLVILGMYGVVSLWARQRNQEFGVRIALGAHARDITRLVVAQGLRFALPGIAVGFVTALLVTRWIAHMLYDVQPTDARTLALVTFILLVVVACAAYLPARAAAARDPLRAIRG